MFAGAVGSAAAKTAGLATRVVCVDSRFRPAAQRSPAKFTWDLGSRVANVVAARVSSVEIPNTVYSFSAAAGTTAIAVLYLGATQRVEIAEGNYTAEELLAALNAAFAALPAGDWEVSMDSVDNRVTVAETNGHIFTLLLDPDLRFREYPRAMGIGAALGFSAHQYAGAATYRSEAPANVFGETALYVEINDWNSLLRATPISGDAGGIAKVIMGAGKRDLVFDNRALVTREIIFPAACDVSSLEVRLSTPDGATADMRSDWAMTVELDVVAVPGRFVRATG